MPTPCTEGEHSDASRVGASYCQRCGKALMETSATIEGGNCGQCDEPLSPKTRFCPHCGAKIVQPADA